MPHVWQRIKTLWQAPQRLATFPLPVLPQDLRRAAQGPIPGGRVLEGPARLAGDPYGTLIELLLIAGRRCEKLMDSIHNVSVTDVQADECWNFIYCKEKNKGPEQADNDEIGDCY